MIDDHTNENASEIENYKIAVKEIKDAILRSQHQAVKGVNSIQLSLYFGVGSYVSKNTRSGWWGTGAIETISEQLKRELPGLRGFSGRNLRNMRQFFECWRVEFANMAATAAKMDSDDQSIDTEMLLPVNPAAMAANFKLEEFLAVSFSHHIEILNKTDTAEERIFYIHQTYIHQWDKYSLRDRLKADLFHHTGQLPNNFEETMPERKSALKAINMLKDEYMLDFINVEEIGERDEQDINERVVENAIVHNIKNFIMTFGKDFAFLGNQYHVEAIGHDHYIDLLFYNRELCSLVAIELKTGTFKPIYLGELNTYLQVLDDFVKKPNENPSIGLVLCKSADKSYAEYAVRDYSKPMSVATYKTASDMPERLRHALPDIEELKRLLQ